MDYDEINNVTLKFNNNIDTCKKMFSGLDYIKEVDLSEFDASKVTDMSDMFSHSNNIEIIKFGRINTSSVKDMQYMFYGCNNLLSIDITNFDTSQVTHMGWMFFGCSKLISIDVSKFNTSLVTCMNSMFCNCNNLLELDLSNFDTTQVTEMCYMFKECKSLTYLDLSGFDTSKVTTILEMFYNDNSLLYLNLYSFKIKNSVKKFSAFDNVNSDIKYCIYDIDTKKYLLGINAISNCSDDYFKKNENTDLDTNICDINKYEYNNICLDKCPNGTIMNNNKCEDNSCKINSTECLNNTPKGYYLDMNDNIYKKCYENCNYCYGKGDKENNSCIECKDNYIFLNDSINNNNCYKKCKHYYYFDEFNNYTCTINNKCPDEYNKLIIEKNKCIDYCENDNIYQYEYNNLCYKHNPNITNKNESIYNASTEKNNINTSSYIINDQSNIINNSKNAKDEYIETFREYIMDDDVLKKVTQNKEDYTKEKEGVLFQITSSDNQKNNSNKNISTIDLGDCEKELKRIYKINETLPLIIFKIDYISQETLIPIVGYEIYHPENKSKLDLIYCKDIFIKLNLPVSIDESQLFKYDPNSGFYTDNCFSYTTENGTDIILNDRKIEFSDKNLSLCEHNCNYTGYNQDDKQSNCNCTIKNKMDLISEIIEKPNKLSDNFVSSKNNSNSGYSNIVTIKCTKALFSKDGLKNNISSYILIIFIFYFLLSITLFIKCGYPLLVNDIDNILREKGKNQKNKSIIKTTGGTKK